MNKIQLAAQFLDANQTLKTLLGDIFDKKNLPYRMAIKSCMEIKNMPIMDALAHLLEITSESVVDIQDRTIAAMHLLAATVEIITKKDTVKSDKKNMPT